MPNIVRKVIGDKIHSVRSMKRNLKLYLKFGGSALRVIVGSLEYEVCVLEVPPQEKGRVTLAGTPTFDISATYKTEDGRIQAVRLSSGEWKTREEAIDAMTDGFEISAAKDSTSAETVIDALVRDGNGLVHQAD